jgi:hypothetical protein
LEKSVGGSDLSIAESEGRGVGCDAELISV